MRISDWRSDVCSSDLARPATVRGTDRRVPAGGARQPVKVTSDQILFSVKLFIAAMLAFAVAVRIGLPQPYWALVTCCVLMNPATGAIRSKAVYRERKSVVKGKSGSGRGDLGGGRINKQKKTITT